MVEKSTLRTGLFMPPIHPINEDPTLAMERDIDLVQWLDKLGYNEAWFGEHHSGGYEITSSPELAMAVAAERTQRIKVGSGVMSLAYHNPFMVANRMVQLDHLTRGRAMFGVGPGLLVSDAMMLGIDVNTQRRRMVESLEVITELLAGKTVTRETDWFKLVDARLQVLPYTQPRPELVVASAVTPSGGETAGRLGAGMLCVAAASMAGYDVLDYNWSLARKIGEEHGHAMDPTSLRLVSVFHIAESRDEALKNVSWGYAEHENYLRHLSPPSASGAGDLKNIGGLGRPEQMIEAGTGAIGTPDDGVALLEKYWEKTGGFGAFLNLECNWANHENTKRSYEMFARYVMPKFASRNRNRAASLEWMGANNADFTARAIKAAQGVIDAHFKEKEERARELADQSR